MTIWLKHQLTNRANKYHAKKAEHDGIIFDSQLEGRYYLFLQNLKRIGSVLFFLRQVPFDLPGNTKYRVDFQVFYTGGYIDFVDVKGRETKDFIRTKKQVEAIYPITISVIKRGDF